MPLLSTEVDDVMLLAWPLPAESRADFVAAVEAALAAHAVRGPGLAYRLARELQRNFYTPPRSPAPQHFNARKHPR